MYSTLPSRTQTCILGSPCFSNTFFQSIQGLLLICSLVSFTEQKFPLLKVGLSMHIFINELCFVWKFVWRGSALTLGAPLSFISWLYVPGGTSRSGSLCFHALFFFKIVSSTLVPLPFWVYFSDLGDMDQKILLEC